MRLEITGFKNIRLTDIRLTDMRLRDVKLWDLRLTKFIKITKSKIYKSYV